MRRLAETGCVYVTRGAALVYADYLHRGAADQHFEAARRELTELLLDAVPSGQDRWEPGHPEVWRFRRRSAGVDISARVVARRGPRGRDRCRSATVQAGLGHATRMKETTTMAHAPLAWPPERPRTPAHRRIHGRFKVSLPAAIDDLEDELRRMGARYPTISSAAEGYERNGVWRPYADATPDDPGVAVYFDLDGDSICLACDRFRELADNVRAIGLTLGAMRGIERWGAGETKRTFAGYRALPPGQAPPDGRADWRAVLGLPQGFGRNGTPKAELLAEIKKRHRELALSAHPDRDGGSNADMVRLNQALDAARAELGLAEP